MRSELENLILELVDKHDGEWSWYHLDRAISNGPTEYVGPFLDETKRLVSASLLEECANPVIPGMPMYRITGLGRSTLPVHRERRRGDFERSARYDPSGVRVHPNASWRWMPVHPMADDTELLVQLNLSPTDCTKVDAYWDTGLDIVFLELLTAAASGAIRPPGLYARVREDDGGTVVHIVLDFPAIDSVEVEKAMDRAQECGLIHSNAAEKIELCEVLALVRDDTL